MKDLGKEKRIICLENAGRYVKFFIIFASNFIYVESVKKVWYVWMKACYIDFNKLFYYI